MTQKVDTLIILGASGDLASRLLMPALGQLLTEQPGRRVHLLGSGQGPMSEAEWTKTVKAAFRSVEAGGPAVDALVESTEYLQADATTADGLGAVLAKSTGTPAIYFAVPPQVTVRACTALASMKLPKGIQLALEKPFGTDYDSAVALNHLLAGMLPENRIHRVDHFLGRSTVFNLMGLRFANRIFEPVWSAEHIASIEVVYDEQLGLENRAGYYDTAGALIDMLQSHLLQVMATLMMDAPATTGAADTRDAKAIVLRATRLWGGSPTRSSRRARYTAGTVAGESMPSYVDEDGVVPSRDTETLAEVTLEVDSWRWKGVPVTLRSGKALGERRREMVIRFKPAQHVPTGLSGASDPTILRILLAPDGMSLELNVNGPGDPTTIDRATMTADFGPGELLAYGEVLSGVLDGDPTLSVRGDMAEDGWRIMAPVLTAWSKGRVPIDDYTAGSEGPADWKPIG